jgi:hypothetical protein
MDKFAGRLAASGHDAEFYVDEKFFTRMTFKNVRFGLWSDRCDKAAPVMYYNFCRIHQTLRVTPAMEAGISDHVWSLEEIVGLLP